MLTMLEKQKKKKTEEEKENNPTESKSESPDRNTRRNLITIKLFKFS